jgi:hypothetical protein
MVVLRDGEWSVWCRCGWRSLAFPALSQLTARHPCGSGGNPTIKGRRAAAPLQRGDALAASHATEPGPVSFIHQCTSCD